MIKDVFFLALRSLVGILFYTFTLSIVPIQQGIIISLVIQFVVSSKGLFDPGLSQYILVKKDVINVFNIGLLRFYMLLIIISNIGYVVAGNIGIGVGTLYFLNNILGSVLYNYFFRKNLLYARVFIVVQILGFVLMFLTIMIPSLRFLMLVYVLPYMGYFVIQRDVRVSNINWYEMRKYMQPIFFISIIYFVYGMSDRLVFHLSENSELNIPAQYLNYVLAIFTLAYGHLARSFVAHRADLVVFVKKYFVPLIVAPSIVIITLSIVNACFAGYKFSYTILSMLIGSLMLSMFMLQIAYDRKKTILISRVQLASLLISIAVVFLTYPSVESSLNLFLYKLIVKKPLQIKHLGLT